MEFFEKVKKTAGSIAKVSSREGKKLYSITKIKFEINDKRNKVKALYKEIGFEAYKAHRADKNVLKHIKSRLEKIDALEEKIAQLLAEIDSIKNVEEVGVEEVPYDEAIEDAEIVEEYDEGEEEYDEDEDAEPIEPIE